MLRLKKIALTEEYGKFFYQGNLFTGVAFTTNEGGMVDAIEILAGIEAGKYFPKYFPVSDCRVIDMEFLEPEDETDYEPFLCFNGERFTGVAFEFDGVFCTGELLYERGWSDSQVTYYEAGRLESIELIENDFSQIYQWYENEQVKRYEVAARSSFSFNLAFNEDGYLSALGMEGDCFNQARLMSDKLVVPFLKEESFIDDLKAAEFLSLSGHSVTDELFKRLISFGGLEQTESISLLQTAVTKEGLCLLRKENRLNKLLINSDIMNLDDVKLFKSDRPDCYIDFNREEISV